MASNVTPSGPQIMLFLGYTKTERSVQKRFVQKSTVPGILLEKEPTSFIKTSFMIKKIQKGEDLGNVVQGSGVL